MRSVESLFKENSGRTDDGFMEILKAGNLDCRIREKEISCGESQSILTRKTPLFESGIGVKRDMLFGRAVGREEKQEEGVFGKIDLGSFARSWNSMRLRRPERSMVDKEVDKLFTQLGGLGFPSFRFSKGKKSKRADERGDDKGDKPEKNGKKGKTPKKNNDKKGQEGNEDKENDKDKEEKDNEKEDDEKSEEDEEEKEEEQDDESESEISSSSEEEDEEEEEEVEPEDYDILKDPDFADLEVKSLFPEDESEENKTVLDKPRTEFYDVLDTTLEVEKRDFAIERKLAKRGIIPTCPSGGWKWRPAKFIVEETPEEGEGVIWKFEFIDDEGGEIAVNVHTNISHVADFESQTKKEKYHKLTKGEKVDVLDYFISKHSKQRMKKWRAAVVKKENPYWVRVHFINWKAVWDEWLHVYMDADRISEFSKMTQRLQRRIKRRNMNFQKVLNRKNKLQLVEMDADGNCLFRTVAHQVYGTPARHRRVREECCNYLQKNHKRFAMFVRNIVVHIRKMRQDKEWGDDTEIRAMEELYDRPFEIYRVRDLGIEYKPMKIHFNGDLPKRIKKVEPIRLSYHGQCHYNSIVPLDLKMKKDKSFPPPKKRTTNLIQHHREKMLKKSAREELKRQKEAREKERLEKEKKRKQEEEEEEKEKEGKEEEGESEEGDTENEEKPVEESNEQTEDKVESEKNKPSENVEEKNKEPVNKDTRKSEAESSGEKSSEASGREGAPPPNQQPKQIVKEQQKKAAEKSEGTDERKLLSVSL